MGAHPGLVHVHPCNQLKTRGSSMRSRPTGQFGRDRTRRGSTGRDAGSWSPWRMGEFVRAPRTASPPRSRGISTPPWEGRAHNDSAFDRTNNRSRVQFTCSVALRGALVTRPTMDGIGRPSSAAVGLFTSERWGPTSGRAASATALSWIPPIMEPCCCCAAPVAKSRFSRSQTAKG